MEQRGDLNFLILFIETTCQFVQLPLHLPSPPCLGFVRRGFRCSIPRLTPWSVRSVKNKTPKMADAQNTFYWYTHARKNRWPLQLRLSTCSTVFLLDISSSFQITVITWQQQPLFPAGKILLHSAARILGVAVILNHHFHFIFDSFPIGGPTKCS